MTGMPRLSALVSLLPAFSPASTKLVFLLTLPAARPPWRAMSASASSRESVGRVPVTVSLNALDRNALVNILTQPKDALVKQYEKLFEIDGIKLEFEQGAIEAIADKAIALDTGARGLRTIIENAMMNLMFTSPSDKEIEKIIITRDFMNGTGDPVIIRKKAA